MSPSSRSGYLLQALAIPLWWLAMWASPDVERAFSYPGIGSDALFAFALPDVLMLATCALVAWYRSSRIAGTLLLGGFAYGALWCLAASITTGGGWLGTSVMLMATLFDAFLLIEDGPFRSSSTGRAANVSKTVAVSAVLWTVTLVALPAAILHALGDWPPRTDATSLAVGGALFVACSALGLWSGAVMVLRGDGTPLPLDAPRRLVTSGPYAIVRNPMAVAGIGQGIAVAIAVRSVEVAVYALVGALVWDRFVRPVEEHWTERRFGADYRRYRDAVRCWIPSPRRRRTEEV